MTYVAGTASSIHNRPALSHPLMTAGDGTIRLDADGKGVQCLASLFHLTYEANIIFQ